MATIRLQLLLSIVIVVIALPPPTKWGDHDLPEQIQKMIRESPDRPVMLHDMRFDGAGSEVAALLLGAGYASFRNWSYGGAFRVSELGVQHHEDVALLADFIFGRHIAFAFEQRQKIHSLNMTSKRSTEPQWIKGPPWPASILWIDKVDFLHEYGIICGKKLVPIPPLVQKLLHTKGGSMSRFVMDKAFSAEFLAQLRESNSRIINETHLFFKPNRLAVAMHLRRGADVSKWHHVERYTPNEYYITLANRIRAVVPDADIHLFSSVEEHAKMSHFDTLLENNLTLHLEDTAPAIVAWTNMIRADIFIMGKSDFSLVPAIMNRNCVVYEPKSSGVTGVMWHWVTEAEFSASYIESCLRVSERRYRMRHTQQA